MKKIIICLFSLLLILCITGYNKEIDKEKIKEELHSDDEVNNLKSRNYEKNVEKIKNQLNQMILTKKQSEELINDSSNFKDLCLNGNKIGTNDSDYCLGVYNDAIVIIQIGTDEYIGYHEIYEYCFKCNKVFQFLVYKDHNFYNLNNTTEAQTLIDNNIITMDNITSIYKTFLGLMASLYDDSISFPTRVPTIEDNFRNDTIVVSLKQWYSFANKPINIKDFETKNLISLKTIEENGKTIKDYKKKIIINDYEDVTRISHPENLIDPSNYCQIVGLYLLNSTKEDILKIIKELEELDYVFAAEPAYIFEVVEA